MDIITELETIRHERHGTEACQKLAEAYIGIAGLGGLGSNIAISLARMGVGHICLVDFDYVDISNIQRQQYFISQISMPKTEALRDTLLKIHPTMHIDIYQDRIHSENAASFFSQCDVVCEAFDDAAAKAMLVETLLDATQRPIIVSGSGMAGKDSGNSIVTRQLMRRLYICGDSQTDILTNGHLYAARVALCANHQALMTLRLILGEYTP